MKSSQQPQPSHSPAPTKEKKAILGFTSPFSKDIKFGSFFGDSKDDTDAEIEQLKQKIENLESELSIQKEMAQTNIKAVVDENERLKKIIIGQDEKIKQGGTPASIPSSPQQQPSEVQSEEKGEPSGESESLRRECEVLRIKISSKDGEIEELNKSISELRGAQEELAKVAAEKTELQERVAELGNERDKAKEDYNRLRKEGDTMKLRMEVLRDDFNAAQKKATKLEGDLERATGELADARKELQDHQTEAKASSEAKDAKIGELEEVRAAHERLVEENATLAAKVCSLEAECKEKTARLCELEQVKSENDANIAEKGAMAEKLSEKSAQCEMLRAELESKREEVSGLSEECAALRERNEKLQKAEAAAEESERKIEAMQKAAEDQKAAYEVQGKKNRQLVKELKGELHKYRQAYEAVTHGGDGGSGGNAAEAAIDCGILTTSDFEEVGVQLGKVAQEKFLLEEQCREYEREVAALKKELEEWKSESTQRYIASYTSRVGHPEQHQQKQTPKKRKFFGGGDDSSNDKDANDSVMSTMKGIMEETLIKNVQLRKIYSYNYCVFLLFIF